MPTATTWLTSTTPVLAALPRRPHPYLVEVLKSGGLTQGLVIDLGCGSGILSHAIYQAGYDVLGVDISEAMIAIARQRVPRGEFRVESLLTAKLPPSVAIAAVGEVHQLLV